MKLNVDLIYPVGSIYMNYDNPTNPSVLFGGTWEAISGGRCLIGVGQLTQNSNTNLGKIRSDELHWYFNPGETLGEVYHQLNVNEMPSHTHGIYGALTGETKAITNYGNDWAVGTTRSWTQNSNSNTGGDGVHNNYQPSLAVYMWRRTA